jgi:ClpP class serine protease
MSRRVPDAVLQAYLSSFWAMTPEAIRKCHAIITRQTPGPEAVAKERGRPLENTREVHVRDAVAYIPIRGPMIRYADSFKAISGATSYEALARDLETSMRDSTVRAIVLDLDTPGGELSGCLDFAEQVFQADQRKPVYALTSGMCASAGYIIAAGARRIIGNPSAVVGSLGVCVSIEDRREADAMEGVRHIEIVSSRTPKKNVDPATAEGRQEMQVVVDALADVVGAQVARHRGLNANTVLEDFGAGVIVVGAQALAAGLIDAVQYSEDFHSELVAEIGQRTFPSARVTRPTAAATSAASLQQELTMKYAKGAKVRVAAGSASVIPVGTEGVIDQVGDAKAANPYGVAFAGGSTIAFLGEKDLEDAAKPAAAAPGEEEEEEEPAAAATPAKAAEGDEDEEGEDEEEEEATPEARGAKAERSRVLGIQALALHGEEQLVQACIDDPTCSVADAALRLRQAQAKVPGDRLAARRSAEAGKPRAGVPGVATPKPGQTPRSARVIAAIGRVFPTKRKEPAPTQ